MRYSFVRTLSAVSLFFVFVLPLSFFGQNQTSKKPAPSVGKTPAETVLHTDQGLAKRVKGPIRRERRTLSGSSSDAADTPNPVETPPFRVMNHPPHSHLLHRHSFH